MTYPFSPFRQPTHCSYCGTGYPEGAPWPRVCAGCGETTWRNPLPVAVALLPVDTSDGRRGLVVVRRDIEPGRGQLGLPGGFIEIGEAWREAAVRELREETTIVADAGDVHLFDVHSAPSGTLLVFGLLPPRREADLPPVVPTEEATEWLIATEAQPLVFSTHTQAMADYFARLPDHFASA